MRIRWSKTALADLKEIAEHIAKDNPVAARRVISEIRDRISVLANHPYVGRSGRTEGTRELVISKYPYAVAYEVGERATTILAVVHTSRLWPESFASE